MKKRNFALCGLAVVAALGIASCNNDKTPDETPKEITNVDVHLNYNGTQGVTYRSTAGSSWANAVDGVTYTQGMLLPTWQAFAKNCDINIREACGYSATKDADTRASIPAGTADTAPASSPHTIR